MRRMTAGLALTIVLVMAGCSGGGSGTPTATPGSASPTELWRPGEFRDALLYCDKVSAATLRRLRVEPTLGYDCLWHAGAGDRHDNLSRDLTANHQIYEPSQARSATDAARNGFPRPRGWEKLGTGVPVRGFGDEAKIFRVFGPSVKLRRAVLVVRLRNAVLQFDLKVESLLDRYRARVGPLEEVEADAVAVAREVLTGLGSPPTPVAPTPANPPGEVRKVSGICGSVGEAGRLVPGIERRDISPAGSALGSGCHWSLNDGRRPRLTVDAEVITASPLTGETGSQIATTIFNRWKSGSERVPRLGDEAKLDHYNFRRGQHRESSILVRRGNLLVYVSYGSWNHPSKATLDREVTNIAKAVLSDHR
ncbi:hypothetical protein [Actinomadura sp. HBU206391]|uniref:hypothetical protein n=1 Tax=Actinomadura sp. HBU206391 TaxID=2731692 RepID=UPI0016506419|nr:hypothetical protein [Actinomadura sp. HBU206391]MBC6457018.1 hypothetical protein [Actinomadura sp. HBU206391]